MALELKLNYNQSKDGKSLVLQDDTNWVEEAIPINTVTAASIKITVGSTIVERDVIADFAAGDPADLIWTFTSADFNLSADVVLTDDVYLIEYFITVGGTDYEVAGYILLYYTVKLYVYTKFAALPNKWSTDLCDLDALLWANKLAASLKALEYSAHLGNLTRIRKNLAFMQKLTKVTSLYELNSKL